MDAIVDHHTMPARQHDLDPARNTDRTRWVWQVLRTFNAFGERWRTGRRSLPADNRRRECGSLFGLNKPPCSGQPAPGEQLAGRQPIPPRRRRHNPRRAVALRHDPLLLRHRPAPPGTCRNNLEPRDLRNNRMVSHTPMSSPSARITQGGARRSDTISHTRSSNCATAALKRGQALPVRGRRHPRGTSFHDLPHLVPSRLSKMVSLEDYAGREQSYVKHIFLE